MDEQQDYEKEAILEMLRIKKSENDLIYFAETYFPHLLKYKTPEFHKEIYYLLLRENRLGIAAPRSFAKSTIVQIIYGIWLLLVRKNQDILTISASGTLAEDWVRRIKMEFETNELLMNDFDYLVWGAEKSTKWTEGHLTIHNPDNTVYSQIRARGRGCQIRGFRPSVVICDDLEDDEEVKSEEQRQKLEDWFLKALLNTIDMSQQVVIIGTMLHPLALLNKIIARKEEFKNWTTRKYKALTDGKSIWEEKWPTSELLRKKAEIGTYAFQSEYQNEPLAGTEQLIKPDWVKKYDVLPEKLLKFEILDPAISEKESADEFGILTLGLDKETGRIYEVESDAGRWGIWESTDKVINTFKRHTPFKIIVEAISFQQVLKPVLIKEARKQGLYLPIFNITLGTFSYKETKEPRDKFTRALGITHLFEQGLVYLKSQKLIDQCLLFPTGDRDDLFDCLVYGLHAIIKYARETNIFFDKSEDMRQQQGFTIKDGQMPCLAPPPGTYPEREQDWRT